MRQSKGKTKGKASPKPRVKRGQPSRNPRGDRSLSLDPPAKDDMPRQTAAAPRHRVHDSIDRVIAGCDRVDAALVELAQQDMPPLAIRELAAADGGAGATRGWAVVSADLRKPLTQWQARAIVAAMQSPRTPAPISIAAE